MNMAIIGASVGVGLASVSIALQRNHTVTTLSRSKLPLPAQATLRALTGDATKKDDLKKAIAGADAIIVAVGTGTNTKPTTLCVDLVSRLLDLHRETPITSPVIILSGFGAGDSAPYQDWLTRQLFRFMLNEIYADKTRMEELIAKSTLNWAIVRPGRLINKPLTGQYRVETRLFDGINIGAINRADVADFLVKQAENPTYLHQYPALANK